MNVTDDWAGFYRSELGRCMESVRRQHEQLGRVTRELNDLRELWRWISIEERLPDEGMPVLVRHLQPNFGGPLLNVASVEDGLWYEVNEWNEICNVTHWMPLPAAPEEAPEDVQRCRRVF